MTENIREKIMDEARILFMKKGYDAVSMREIAKACHISVGNLTYHFARKEDLLMTLHDMIMNAYLCQLPETTEKGLAGYFAMEYAFHRFIVESAPFFRLYKQVINSPGMRNTFYRKHHMIYQKNLNQNDESDKAWYSTVVMSSLEFQLMEAGALSEDFDFYIRKIFQARLLFLEADMAEGTDVIEKGMEEGRRLYEKIDISFLESPESILHAV